VIFVAASDKAVAVLAIVPTSTPATVVCDAEVPSIPVVTLIEVLVSKFVPFTLAPVFNAEI
jgi:hypothetical protein